ncbi:MAG: MalT-like region [Cyanobacteriota bacterium erpe_2018_sw_21hr_WHONDRS-SW48-000092_B_bin.40]|jgi:tetratricopeptide (TPR) repeat protein|nr:MalT-like region [Cyanobacteriota bacterium erpe_2018_sw_21hr_WHONDRS-SW48-000092_B_bin.40]
MKTQSSVGKPSVFKVMVAPSGMLLLPVLQPLVSLFTLSRKLNAAERVAKFCLLVAQSRADNTLDAAWSLALLAEVLRCQGRFAEAEATAREAIAMYQQCDAELAQASAEKAEQKALTHELLGTILRDLGRYSEALKAGKTACEMAEQMQKDSVTTNSPFILADCYLELSRTLNFTGQPDDAITLLHQALDLRGGTEEDLEGETGDVDGQSGDSDAAKDKPATKSKSADRYKANILAELSRSYLMSGEFKEAQCAADKAMANLIVSDHAEDQLARARVILAVADVLKQSPEKTAEERSKATAMRAEALAIRKKWLSAKDPELLDIGGG